jgi:ribonuclease Y
MGIFDTVNQLFSGKSSAGKLLAKPPEKKKIKVAQPKPQVDLQSIQAEVRAAQAEARAILAEARDESFRIKQNAFQEVRRGEELIVRRTGALEEREKLLGDGERRLQQTRVDLDRIRAEQLDKLERIARLTRDEAKDLVLKTVQDKMHEEVAKIIHESEENAREEAQKKAREILVDAMKHGATDYVAEYTVSTVKLPDEEMKGRIIGKEGRNIRTFEQVTGVDVDLDEEGVIRLSSFDPVRREIARVTLERLMKDGRIQPARIEELVEQVKKDIERIMMEEGERLCHLVGVFNLPRPLVGMLGRFKYRFSYGQNMIAHTLEETKIGIALAHEVGADVNVVRLGCLLHDIGKIVTEEEGNHIELGVDLLRKYNMPQSVINCVAEHHEDKPFSSVESMLVYISDAISGSRPGARYEDIEGYIKRLSDLEQISKSHEGVKEAYAFQAGRELRVIVEPDKVDDARSVTLAHQIKEEIEQKLTYPGNIRVTVIRELRAVDIAK